MSASGITTKAKGFHWVPSQNLSLFQVKAGAPADTAISTCRCILESLIDMATEGVDGGIDSTQAYAMGMLLEMVDGLIGGLEGVI